MEVSQIEEATAEFENRVMSMQVFSRQIRKARDRFSEAVNAALLEVEAEDD